MIICNQARRKRASERCSWPSSWPEQPCECYQLGVKGFWGDEIWTAQRSLWPPAQIINFSLDNTVGPWTYLAGWLSLTLLGTNLQEFVLRWPSVSRRNPHDPRRLGVGASTMGQGGRPRGGGAGGRVALSGVVRARGALTTPGWSCLRSASSYFLYRAFEQPRRAAFWAGLEHRHHPERLQPSPVGAARGRWATAVLSALHVQAARPLGACRRAGRQRHRSWSGQLAAARAHHGRRPAQHARCRRYTQSVAGRPVGGSDAYPGRTGRALWRRRVVEAGSF